MESLDVNAVITLISGVGFPIVACIGLFYLYDRTIKELTLTLSKIDSTLDNINKRLEKLEERNA